MALAPTPIPPGPGDTVTSGTWTPGGGGGDTGQGGQNQTLRKKLGLGRGMLGFAFGTAQVPAPAPPGPGDTVTSGTWTPAGGGGDTGQGGQNQTLRKKLGLGMKAFAKGTANVQPSAPPDPAPVFLPAPTPDNPGPQHSAINNALSFKLGPLAVGSTAQDIMASAPAMPNGQPGGSVPPPSMLAGKFGRTPPNNAPPNNAPLVAPAPVPDNVHHNPVGRAAGVVNPNAPATPAPVQINGKDVTDPEVVAHKAILSGSTMSQAHAMHSPGQYSPEEFADAVRGMPLGVLSKLWNFQHYLSPEQAIIPQLLGQAHQPVDTAKKAYDAAVANGATPEALKTLAASHNQALANYYDTTQKLAFHMPFLPSSQPPE